MRFRHTAVDDVTHEPVSELLVQPGFGLIRVAITTVDPDVPRVSHWLTPIAAAELVRTLTSDPDVRDAVLNRSL